MNEDVPTGFDDDGKPVPVCWPGEVDLTPEARIVLKFENAGCKKPERLLAAIQPDLDELMDAHAMEFLRRVIAKLEGTAAGVALARTISGDATPLRESAKAAGVSHVAVFLQEKTVRKRLGLTRPPPLEN